MAESVIQRRETHIDGGASGSLFERVWVPENPRIALLLVHGFAEHSGRYEALGAWFAERGVAVHAFDLRGHGRSDGLRGHVRRFRDYHDDVELMLGRLADEYTDRPRFLVGHSMGGLIVASYLCERPVSLSGAVLSAPGLDFPQNRKRWQLTALRALRHVAPRFVLDSGLDASELSRDPEVGRRYLEDPLVDTRMTVSLAAELFSTALATQRCADRIAVPVLMLHGEADRICLPNGTRAFQADLTAPGSALHLYPDLRHEIFNEPEREKVLGDMLGWLEER